MDARWRSATTSCPSSASTARWKSSAAPCGWSPCGPAPGRSSTVRPSASCPPDEASSPGYRHALERQHTRPDLPYGLDLRRDGARVLGVLWADDGACEVAAFVRGPWEDEALALAL